MNLSSAEYDNPWKEAISVYFRHFMAFFFPEIEIEIDWNREYEFLDKEFQQIANLAEIGTRFADKLVKVWVNDGQEIWVLIHIEVQSQVQKDFTERMYIYNYRIFDLYHQQVVSLAILADETESWRPNKYQSYFWGCRLELEFPIVKLLDYAKREEFLKESTNPFAVITEAHLTTQKTKQNPIRRYQGKLGIVKSFYQRGYTREDILELFKLIDWMMTLPPELENQFTEEIKRYEEKDTMPYVTSVERLGQIKGQREGSLQNAKESVIEVLEVRFEEVPVTIVETINQIQDTSMLKSLHRQAITIGSIEEFEALLGNQKKEDNGV